MYNFYQMQFASVGTLSVKMSDDPVQLKVLKTHEESLIGLMKGSIDRIKLQLHAEGMLTDLNIDQKFAVLSTMNRMQKVLEFVLTQMTEESEKKSKETFDHFLETLDEDLAWENLKENLGKSLCKCTVCLMLRSKCTYVQEYPGIDLLVTWLIQL